MSLYDGTITCLWLNRLLKNTLHEIEKDSLNIVLINSHPAFESGIPLPPNALEIAGLNAQAVQPIAGEVVVMYPEVKRNCSQLLLKN